MEWEKVRQRMGQRGRKRLSCRAVVPLLDTTRMALAPWSSDACTAADASASSGPNWWSRLIAE